MMSILRSRVHGFGRRASQTLRESFLWGLWPLKLATQVVSFGCSNIYGVRSTEDDTLRRCIYLTESLLLRQIDIAARCFIIPTKSCSEFGDFPIRLGVFGVGFHDTVAKQLQSPRGANRNFNPSQPHRGHRNNYSHPRELHNQACRVRPSYFPDGLGLILSDLVASVPRRAQRFSATADSRSNGNSTRCRRFAVMHAMSGNANSIQSRGCE